MFVHRERHATADMLLDEEENRETHEGAEENENPPPYGPCHAVNVSRLRRMSKRGKEKKEAPSAKIGNGEVRATRATP